MFVVDSSEPGVDGPVAGRRRCKRIDGLTTHSVSRPLNVAMGEVYAAVAECDRPVHVVYVLTDLARTRPGMPSRPAEGLDKVAKIKRARAAKMVTFLARLTPQEIHNVSVDSAEPSQSIVTQGEPVEIRARIRSQAKGQPARTDADGRVLHRRREEEREDHPAPRGRRTGRSDVSASRRSSRKASLHRGEVELQGAPDPFEDDDRRYFTFRIRPAMKVLLVSDRHDDAEFVAAALDPDPSPSSPRTFVVDRQHDPANSRPATRTT